VTEPAKASVVAHWLQLQQQYWEMWQTLARQLLDSPPADANPSKSPWSEMLELYWQTLSPSLTPEIRTIVRKFIDQSKNFSQFNNALLEAVQKTADSTDSDLSSPWLNAWGANFNDIYNNFSKFLTETDGSLNVWQLLQSNWWRMMMFSASFSHSPSFTIPSGGMQENLEKLLSMPTLGYTRTWQAKWQDGIKHWQAFQTAQQDYSGILNQISLRSIELLREKTRIFTKESDAHAAPEMPKTMRAIYDLWVECGEEAYAEFVRTEEYAQINANLINTLMACKHYEQEMTDSLLNALNMPTRKELDTFSLRMQQMRRELKILQAKQVTGEIDILTSQINVLRAEMDTLKAAKSNIMATPAVTKSIVAPTKSIPASKTATSSKKTAKKTISRTDSPSHSTDSSTATPSSLPPPPSTSDKQGK
jgi:polyhydroxyalkanoate synthase subunit PhaE